MSWHWSWLAGAHSVLPGFARLGAYDQFSFLKVE